MNMVFKIQIHRNISIFHRYYPVSSNYEPKRGDLFFHLKKIIVDGKEKWVGHTGIIIAYDKGTDIIFYRRKYR